MELSGFLLGYIRCPGTDKPVLKEFQMNPQKPLPERPLSKDRLQDKADILENNLFSAVSKQKDKINIHFKINREQFPDAVILMALSQLFPRINIKGNTILLILKKMLPRTIPKDNQLKIKKQLLNLAEIGNPDLAHLELTLEIMFTCKLLSLALKGTPEIPSRDGAIAKAFFDHSSCPGMLLKNGGIDYREINRYPIVKKGDNLFFIAPESQGKPGMGYDGKVIQNSKALPLELNMNGGVERVDTLDTGKNPGYFLKAGKTGVVLLTRTDSLITGIEISDELDVNRLDYSTGNIGTHFICPISMKIDTICGGFKIRARGMVTANVLEGGEIETDRQAQVHTIEPSSKVTAREDIIFHFARDAVLTSKTGCITILEELMDSTLFSRGISFEKKRGTLIGNTLDAETILLKNIYFGGENTLYFGRRLFAERQGLFDSREKLEQEMLSSEEKEKELMEHFLHELKRLTKATKNNPMLKDNIKNLILATRKMDFDILDRELEAIGNLMNTKEVSAITKRLETLKEIKNKPFKEQAEELDEKMDETNQRMSVMTLSIEGFIRRAGTLKIYTGAVENDLVQKPEVFFESEKNEDTFIKINCTYNSRNGFKITRN
jgi:uncharacterized protein (DUF342 family)